MTHANSTAWGPRGRIVTMYRTTPKNAPGTRTPSRFVLQSSTTSIPNPRQETRHGSHTLIVAALAAGATAGLTATAEQAVKDAYGGIKTWLKARYASVNLTALEKDPKSANRQGVLAEDLADAGAGEDPALQQKAQELLALLAQSEVGRAAAAGAGVILREVEVGQDLTVEEIIASGTGFFGERLKIQGNLTIRGVDAGQGGGTASNP